MNLDADKKVGCVKIQPEVGKGHAEKKTEMKIVP